ncbi:hypothetical protein QBC46DRAFT_270510 [Diplogelasinospora grovesii]|uniref:Mei5 protein n=1 Tax=Diplogelasinospora grovesii TaxID=303347 RepID=A0AAN6MZ07_9PEZI|nr:hypothetical protein QBC46DRAFT_270510 [Diplogelasinospora grovesii]
MGADGDVDPTQAVDGLVRAIRDLTADANYKLVADVFSEFLFLKDHNSRLSISHRETLEEYRKFRNELEAQKEVIEGEKRALEGVIQDKIKEIVELNAAKASLECQLEDTKGSLELEKKNAAEAAATAAKELADLQAAKAGVEQEKADVEAAAAAAAEKASGEIAALTETKEGLEAWKAQAEADAEVAKKEIADLQEAKAAVEQAKKEGEDAAEAAAATAAAEIASLEGAKATLETEKAALEDKLQNAINEIASLQSTLEERNAEIASLQAQLKAEGERADAAIAHGEKLQSKLDDTTHMLNQTTDRLQGLERYRIELMCEPEDTYVQVLDKIWTTIVTLVEGAFRPDIDENILADPSCWTNLRTSPYLKNATQLQIPLPQSNSPSAKGMRIAAVLAVLSRALHRHLFRPVYLLDDDDENLVKFLRAVEDEDPAREAHCRATLLCTLPERQQAQGARRVKTVVREVSWLVQHLLGALQFEAFHNGLEAACRLACEQWMRIQLSQMKIEPYFGPPYDDFDWQVLELPEFAEAHISGGSSVVDDGDDAITDGPLETVEAGDAGGDGGEDGAHGMDGDGGSATDEVEPDEILLVVWPSMCSVESGDLMSITQGLVISKEQARPALEEVRSRLTPRPNSRRARTLSMPGHSRSSSPRKPFFGAAPQPADASADDGSQDS